MKKAFLLILIFPVLALLQMSFLAHFAIQGFVIPVVLIAVFVASILSPASSAALVGAFAGGVLLDVFSQHVFGYWTATLVLISFAISFIMHTYVRLPFLKRNY